MNTYATNNNTCVPAGQTVRLMPQLPEGEEDTGLWKWNTGETTRDITVTADKSYIYRVTYTNRNGVQSQLCFPIAVAGDCSPTALTPHITLAGKTTETNAMDVLYGQLVTLAAIPSRGWGTYKWSSGATTESITKSVTADAHYTVEFKNQGGAVSTQTFSLRMLPAKPYVQVGTAAAKATSEVAVKAGQSVTLGLTLPSAVKAANVTWSDGTTGATLTIDGLQTSGTTPPPSTCTALKTSSPSTSLSLPPMSPLSSPDAIACATSSPTPI